MPCSTMHHRKKTKRAKKTCKVMFILYSCFLNHSFHKAEDMSNVVKEKGKQQLEAIAEWIALLFPCHPLLDIIHYFLGASCSLSDLSPSATSHSSVIIQLP